MDDRDATAARGDLSPADYADVLSIVSHDIRAPLGVILGGVTELQDARIGPLTDEQRKLVMLVRRGGERLTRLAANVLFLKRSLTGVGLVAQRGDLRDMARRSVELFERSGELGKVAVRLDAPSERVEVEAEAELVVQAIVNLIANALRAGRQQIVVTVAAGAEGATLTVDDDGPGFPTDVLATLGQKPDAALPNRARGSRGLGLFVVQGVADAHGARLSGETRVDATGRPSGARAQLRFRPVPVTQKVP